VTDEPGLSLGDGRLTRFGARAHLRRSSRRHWTASSVGWRIGWRHGDWNYRARLRGDKLGARATHTLNSEDRHFGGSLGGRPGVG
jgi:hypothetical protein